MTTDPEIGALVQHKIAVEDDERKFDHSYKWESCCLRVDKRALSFFTQLAISASIVSFTVSMMIFNLRVGVSKKSEEFLLSFTRKSRKPKHKY